MSREKIRAIGRYDRLFLGHVLSPRDFRLKNAPSHYELNALLNSEHDRIAVMCHRGWAKSTIIGYIDPLHDILYATLDDPEFILVIAETQIQSINHVVRVRNALEFNTRVHQVFGDGFKGRGKWGSTEIFTTNGCRLAAVGTGQRLRGLVHDAGVRPTSVKLDDCESETNALTEEMRKKNWGWLHKVVIPMMDERRHRVCATQTPVGNDCMIWRLIEHPMWKSLITPLYRGKLFSGEVSWPARWTWEQIENLRREYELSDELPSFNQEYLLIPDSGAGTRIREEDRRYYSGHWVYDYDRHTVYIAGFQECLKDGTKISEPENRVISVATGLDPALGTKSAHCLTGFASVGIDSSYNYFIGPAVGTKSGSPREIGHAFAEFSFENRAQSIGVETVGFQVSIGEAVEEWCDDHGVAFESVNAFNPRMPKDERLSWVILKFQQRKVWLPVDGVNEYLQQEIDDWPTPRHKDMFDALYYAMKSAWAPSKRTIEELDPKGFGSWKKHFDEIPSARVS